MADIIKCTTCGKRSPASEWNCDFYDKEDTAVCPFCNQGFWPATNVRAWIEPWEDGNVSTEEFLRGYWKNNVR